MADRSTVGARRRHACQDLRPGVLPRLSWSACLSSLLDPTECGHRRAGELRGPLPRPLAALGRAVYPSRPWSCAHLLGKPVRRLTLCCLLVLRDLWSLTETLPPDPEGMTAGLPRGWVPVSGLQGAACVLRGALRVRGEAVTSVGISGTLWSPLRPVPVCSLRPDESAAGMAGQEPDPGGPRPGVEVPPLAGRGGGRGEKGRSDAAPRRPLGSGPLWIALSQHLVPGRVLGSSSARSSSSRRAGRCHGWWSRVAKPGARQLFLGGRCAHSPRARAEAGSACVL